MCWILRAISSGSLLNEPYRDPKSSRAGGCGSTSFKEPLPPKAAGVASAQPHVLFSLLDPWTKDGQLLPAECLGPCWRGCRGLDTLPTAGEEGVLQCPPWLREGHTGAASLGHGIHSSPQGGKGTWVGGALPLSAHFTVPGRKHAACDSAGAPVLPGFIGHNRKGPERLL